VRRSALKTNSQGFLVSSKQEINLKKFFIVQKEGSCEVKREKSLKSVRDCRGSPIGLLRNEVEQWSRKAEPRKARRQRSWRNAQMKRKRK